jgi:NAD(P)-dependent dehydrogenase (short-subunit alcohol dehydrogenase family)
MAQIQSDSPTQWRGSFVIARNSPVCPLPRRRTRHRWSRGSRWERLLPIGGRGRLVYAQRISVNDLQNARGTYDGAKAYARTKRGQVILTELWAGALAPCGIVVHAMHPGWSDTPGVSTSLPRFYKLTKPLLRSPAQGADTIVWLCAADEAGRSTGKFWHDRTPRPTHRFAGTRETAEEREALWSELCRYSGWSGTLKSLADDSQAKLT